MRLVTRLFKAALKRLDFLEAPGASALEREGALRVTLHGPGYEEDSHGGPPSLRTQVLVARSSVTGGAPAGCSRVPPST